jgi:hypothetical protein
MDLRVHRLHQLHQLHQLYIPSVWIMCKHVFPAPRARVPSMADDYSWPGYFSIRTAATGRRAESEMTLLAEGMKPPRASTEIGKVYRVLPLRSPTLAVLNLRQASSIECTVKHEPVPSRSRFIVRPYGVRPRRNSRRCMANGEAVGQTYRTR